MNKHSLYSVLLFTISVALFIYVGIATGRIIATSEQTLHFQDTNNSSNFELKEETNFFLMADFTSGNNNNVGLSGSDCGVFTTNTSDNQLICNSDFFSTIQEVQIDVVNVDTMKPYYFRGMGNTEITTNSYSAVAKITLPAGNYQVETSMSTFSGAVNFKLQNSSIINNIFVIVFGSILAIAAMVGFVIMSSINNRKKKMQNNYNYSGNILNDKEISNDLYDEDDPFSKYDLK